MCGEPLIANWCPTFNLKMEPHVAEPTHILKIHHAQNTAEVQ